MNPTPNVNVIELVKSHDRLLHALVSLLGKMGGSVFLTPPDLMISPEEFRLEIEAGDDGVKCSIIGKDEPQPNASIN